MQIQLSLPTHGNMMANKGFNLLEECSARYVHGLLLPGGTVKYTHGVA